MSHRSCYCDSLLLCLFGRCQRQCGSLFFCFSLPSIWAKGMYYDTGLDFLFRPCLNIMMKIDKLLCINFLWNLSYLVFLAVQAVWKSNSNFQAFLFLRIFSLLETLTEISHPQSLLKFTFQVEHLSILIMIL